MTMIYCTALSHLALDGSLPSMQVLLYCAQIRYKKQKVKNPNRPRVRLMAE